VLTGAPQNPLQQIHRVEEKMIVADYSIEVPPNKGRIMKKQISRLKRSGAALALALVLAGCGQTPAIIIDDRGDFKKHENLIMTPEPSAESTNQELWMDMQGGG
jgi:hypothetical protein